MNHTHQTFIEELLRTGVVLADLCEDLLDALPEDAFPGEDNGAVLIEMIIGSTQPVAAAAGEAAVTQATALITATMDRILSDLKAAAVAARAA